jgi:hypothetical protein
MLEILNIIFTLIFFVEMILKLIGLGPTEYSRDPFNNFDAFIVVVSMVDFILFISQIEMSNLPSKF